jgi:quercetin dioxygenase-like cupin family protein
MISIREDGQQAFWIIRAAHRMLRRDRRTRANSVPLFPLTRDGLADTLDTSQHKERVIMKVVTLQEIPNVPVEGAAEPIEGWKGPVSRSRQTIIEPGDSANYNCSVVNFSQGCTTGWHTHTCDQVLIVTSGSGMVATEQEKREINVGDVVHIKAGERHWHGAKADTTMGHITITAVGGQATWG